MEIITKDYLPRYRLHELRQFVQCNPRLQTGQTILNEPKYLNCSKKIFSSFESASHLNDFFNSVLEVKSALLVVVTKVAHFREPILCEELQVGCLVIEVALKK